MRGVSSGPLQGVRVVELAGIGPAPFAAMHLADLGADVIRVDRPGGGLLAGPAEHELLTRGRPSVALDLKHPVFDGSDACVAPVLTHAEAAEHPHLRARGTYVEHAGLGQPAPAPRFSATPAELTTGPSRAGADTVEALRRWGVDADPLLACGAAVQE